MFTAIVQTLNYLCPAEEERFFFEQGEGYFLTVLFAFKLFVTIPYGICSYLKYLILDRLSLTVCPVITGIWLLPSRRLRIMVAVLDNFTTSPRSFASTVIVYLLAT